MRFIMCDFRILRPQYESRQEDALNWIVHAHAYSKYKENLSSENRKSYEEYFEQMRKIVQRFACKSDKIRSRGSDIADFLHINWDSMEIFNLNKGISGAYMNQRMQFFDAKAQNLINTFYDNIFDPPQNLIHVSCTGYISPSAPQKLVANKDWGNLCQVTNAYHMGCYASLPAVRMAEGFLLNESRNILLNNIKKESRVDIVHTEMCTLHFNPSLHDPEQIVVQSLFSDGHIKYTLCDYNDYNLKSSNCAFELLTQNEVIFSESHDAMTWRLSDFGFQMAISRRVPSIIAENIEKFLENMFIKASLIFSEEKENAIFAIHPGGPKIIEYIRDILNLMDDQISFSQEILFEFGNMSSATLPHIWERISRSNVLKDTLIVSLAFGPGLTISGSVMRVI
ncbi:3-oxoacyl-[acyl-carrier-protein] synthase III C-terminal domain-containing protein [Fluviispira multicolorata]|uniref:Chalcone/stilbene synthase C-terminal domain-containing protein n=1 Tax=Fluviispira multicolorata TaxID=2654512 RepID=A0A833JF13_9BACT|nr:3-oxoacyl-[acyl-carrier-protein] synthase III C-terminal domain-containing protein [Fluviispira multicolorata]KAB8030790.1 hypothetical protein GCL57_07395 [Fluviispira multicolorata]